MLFGHFSGEAPVSLKQTLWDASCDVGGSETACVEIRVTPRPHSYLLISASRLLQPAARSRFHLHLLTISKPRHLHHHHLHISHIFCPPPPAPFAAFIKLMFVRPAVCRAVLPPSGSTQTDRHTRLYDLDRDHLYAAEHSRPPAAEDLPGHLKRF